MGKLNSTVTDRELFEWYAANKNTPATSHTYRGGKPDTLRQSTIWSMRQFDPLIVWQALQGIEPKRERTDRPGQWDLFRVIRAYVAIIEDERVDKNGKPVVTAQAKLSALEQVRRFMQHAAAAHMDFALGRSCKLPAEAEIPDPILLKLQAAEAEPESN